jgi:hydrogenase-4 component B
VPGSETLLAAALAATVVGALLVPLLPPAPRKPAFLAAVGIECLVALGAAVGVLSRGAIRVELWSLPSIGRAGLALDVLGAVFVVVTGLVFLVGCAYASHDLGTSGGQRRSAVFTALYQLLFGAILVVLAAGDVLSFLVGWEAMSLLLYGLVVLGNDEDTRPGYLMVAMGEAGMVAGAAGLLLLAAPATDLGFAALRAAAPGLDAGLTWAVFLLTFFGFGVKAGLFPVNQWLADAYAVAPRGFRPVLAGAASNIGIYAIARIDLDLLSPSLAGPGLLVLVVGSLTALSGILYATIQADLRKMLAHSSIENMGIVVAALGAGLVFRAQGHGAAAAMAYVAALYHLTNHAFYKTLLFTGAGSVEVAAASSDMDGLGGLLRRMPMTGLLFLVGIVAIASLPPLNGFVSEWLTLETMLRAAVLSSTVAKVAFALSGAVLALTAGLAVTCFVKAFAMSFLGACRSPEAAVAREASHWARVPMAALALACLLLGVLPTYAIPLFDRAARPLVAESAVEALVPPFFAGGETAATALPPAFREEFHELGAEVGAGVLPGRGLVVLHRGGANNPVVFAMSTTYMTIAFGILLLLTYLVFRLLTLRHEVTRGTAWDGGLRRLRPGYTYTATGFSNPVRVVFHAILRPRTVEDSTEAVAEHFRTAIRRSIAAPHITDRLVLDPVVAFIRRLANVLRGMHHGQVNAYAAYVLLVVLLGLVVGLGLATLEGPPGAAL